VKSNFIVFEFEELQFGVISLLKNFDLVAFLFSRTFIGHCPKLFLIFDVFCYNVIFNRKKCAH